MTAVPHLVDDGGLVGEQAPYPQPAQQVIDRSGPGPGDDSETGWGRGKRAVVDHLAVKTRRGLQSHDVFVDGAAHGMVQGNPDRFQDCMGMCILT